MALDGNDQGILRSASDLCPAAKIVTLPASSGAAKCRNAAIAQARGSLIANLDSDDVWEPSHLAIHVAGFRKDEHLVLQGSRASFIDELGRASGNIPVGFSRFLAAQLLIRNVFVHSGVVFRREKALELGGYHEQLAVGEDYWLWLNLAMQGSINQLAKRTVRYRRHSLQTSRGGVSQVDATLIRQAKLNLGHFLGISQPLLRPIVRLGRP